jgi:membrane protein implicated in regulation of membrane protease activity
MSKTALINAEAFAVIVAVSIPVHYLGGFAWAWAIVTSAVTSIVLRWLIHGGTFARMRKRPLTGGR